MWRFWKGGGKKAVRGRVEGVAEDREAVGERRKKGVVRDAWAAEGKMKDLDAVERSGEGRQCRMSKWRRVTGGSR